MRNYLYHIKLLAYRIAILLVLFQLSRFYFFFTNYSKFTELEFPSLIWAFIVGFRFDIASITVFDSIFILLSILPFQFLSNKAYQTILKVIFILTNIPLLISNLMDAEYFRFTQKRSTFDIFDTLGNDDFLKMISSYLKDYWLIFLISIFIIYILIKLYPKSKPYIASDKNILNPIYKGLAFLILTSLTVISIRGLDHRPIAITSAAKFANAQTVSLVLNTPFTILKTIDKESLDRKTYFSKTESLRHFSPICQNKDSIFSAKNVVIIILESFGKEYSQFYNPKKQGFTPFLDSLSQSGLCFRYSFANGQRSMEAMSSIFNSSPSLMDRPFVISQYASNQTEGLAAILQKLGYHTSFMHGGSNGTMDFDKFCYMSGFQEYYGRNEYPDPKDFDGHWGISDEPYLKYAANKMSEFAPPFFNAIFTLSSHHPYEIPFKYQGMFPKGSMEIEQSIAYADFALKGFFEEAKQQDWYNNTLFVITADHTSMSEASYYQRQIGNYAVPIIFYSPSDSSLKGFSKQLAQHIDIMPSILDYLNYPKTYYCFGTSLFDANRQPFYINYLNDRYVFAKDDLCCIYYDEAVQAIYKWKSDSSLKKNLINNINVKTQFENRGLDQLKAVIQTYNNDFIDNKSNPQAYQNIEIESHDKH